MAGDEIDKLQSGGVLTILDTNGYFCDYPITVHDIKTNNVFRIDDTPEVCHKDFQSKLHNDEITPYFIMSQTITKNKNYIISNLFRSNFHINDVTFEKPYRSTVRNLLEGATDVCYVSKEATRCARLWSGCRQLQATADFGAYDYPTEIKLECKIIE